MVSIKNQSEKKRQSPIIGGRCGVLVRDFTNFGRVVWSFYVKNNLKEARELAADYTARGLCVGICKRSSTIYKEKNFVSVEYSIIERLIPSAASPLKKYGNHGAGGFVDVVFHFHLDGWGVLSASVCDDAGRLSDSLGSLHLGFYNGRAVWC